jgi:5,10-methylenetetrahydrofolate reductase
MGRRLEENVNPRSRLEAVLRAGHFAVTAELPAIDSPDPAVVRKAAEGLAGVVDAANATDNSAAHVHMSSVAVGHLALDAGLEPIVQFTCRDRNRLALQADVLGAAALGIRNVEAMTGDDVSAGDHPEARPLWDLDSVHLLRTMRVLADRGVYLSGRPLEEPPPLFIGAVENPFAPPQEFRARRLATKVEAGADFVQTQIVFNVPRLRAFMGQAVDLGITERCFVIPSVCVPRSARAARYLRDEVPGIDVPDDAIRRLESVPEDRQPEEGARLALEILAELREVPGVAGVHLIAIKWQEAIVRVAEEAGLLPRPEVLVPA